MVGCAVGAVDGGGSGMISHWHSAASPSSMEDAVVVTPLRVMVSVAGYLHLRRIWWFLRALVIVARFLRHCKICLD